MVQVHLQLSQSTIPVIDESITTLRPTEGTKGRLKGGEKGSIGIYNSEERGGRYGQKKINKTNRVGVRERPLVGLWVLLGGVFAEKKNKHTQNKEVCQ